MKPAPSAAQQPEAPSAELPSYCKSLFSGVIAADLVFPFPELPADEAADLAGFLDDLERFLDAKVDGEAFDRDAAIPEGVLEGLAERGVFGLYVPEEYGGVGFGQRQANRVSARIAARALDAVEQEAEEVEAERSSGDAVVLTEFSAFRSRVLSEIGAR